MKLIGLVALLSLAAVGQSHAENYLVSVGGNFETQIFVDTKRIMVKPTETLAWILTVKNNGKELKYSRSLERYDCKQRQSTIVSYVSYDATGNPLSSFDGDGKMKYAVPDTIGEATLEFVCAPAASRAAMARTLAPDELSQTLKAAEYFYNNQSTSATKTNPQSPTVKALISEWYDQNSACRGNNDPAIYEKACKQREATGDKLQKLGWCYGEGAEFAN